MHRHQFERGHGIGLHYAPFGVCVSQKHTITDNRFGTNG